MTAKTDATATTQANGTGPAESAATAAPVAEGPRATRPRRSPASSATPAAPAPCDDCNKRAEEQAEGLELLGLKVDALSVQVSGLGKLVLALAVGAVVAYVLAGREDKDG